MAHLSVHERTSLQNQRTSSHESPPSAIIWAMGNRIPHIQHDCTAASRSPAGAARLSASTTNSPPVTRRRDSRRAEKAAASRHRGWLNNRLEQCATRAWLPGNRTQREASVAMGDHCRLAGV